MPVSEREVRGKALKSESARVYAEKFGVYGAVKVWAQLNREGIDVARWTVERLMGKLALRGVVRGKSVRTTFTDDTIDRPRELVTLEWVHWFNHQRIFQVFGRIPPAKFEDLYYHQTNAAKRLSP